MKFIKIQGITTSSICVTKTRSLMKCYAVNCYHLVTTLQNCTDFMTHAFGVSDSCSPYQFMVCICLDFTWPNPDKLATQEQQFPVLDK